MLVEGLQLDSDLMKGVNEIRAVGHDDEELETLAAEKIKKM